MSVSRRVLVVAALLGLACAQDAPAARAQGCSQCREAVGQAPARTQSAYRKGIMVLAGAATFVFGAAGVALRRSR